jgi:hypothetical protein
VGTSPSVNGDGVDTGVLIALGGGALLSSAARRRRRRRCRSCASVSWPKGIPGTPSAASRTHRRRPPGSPDVASSASHIPAARPLPACARTGAPDAAGSRPSGGAARALGVPRCAPTGGTCLSSPSAAA